MQTPVSRPTGITILAILEAIGSLFLLIGGLGIVLAGPLLYEMMPFPGIAVGIVAILIGGTMIIFGLIGFAIVWGLWTGQGWAWTLAFILSIIGIVIGILNLPSGIVGLVIQGLIAYYLWQPSVKTYYGKRPSGYPYAAPTTQPPYPPQYPPRPPPGTVPPTGAVYCSRCGASNTPDSRFCYNCGSELRMG